MVGPGVISVVRCAHAAYWTGVVLEAGCCALAAAACVLAASITQGHAESEPGVGVLTGLCAAAAGFAAVWSSRRTLPATAAALDRQLAARGEISTASERERRGDRGSFARLLSMRARARLAVPRALAAGPRSPAPAIAAVLGAGALYLLAREAAAQREAERSAWAAGAAIGAAASSTGDADRESLDAQIARVELLAGELGDLGNALPAGPARGPLAAELSARAEELAERLAELERRLGPEPDASGRRAEAALALARQALAELPEDSAATRWAGAEGEAQPAPVADGGALASGSGDGRMSAPLGAQGPLEPGTRVTGTRLPPGTGGGRWWPALHDPVVVRYLEARQGESGEGR